MLPYSFQHLVFIKKKNLFQEGKLEHKYNVTNYYLSASLYFWEKVKVVKEKVYQLSQMSGFWIIFIPQ